MASLGADYDSTNIDRSHIRLYLFISIFSNDPVFSQLRPTTSLTTSFGARNSAIVDGKGGMNYGTNGSRSRSQPRPGDKGKEPLREVPSFGKSNHPNLLITSCK